MVGVGVGCAIVFTIKLLILWYIVMKSGKDEWMQLNGTSTALLDARAIGVLGGAS